MNKRKFKFDKLGIWFNYKGDCVGWIWPWKRGKNNHKRWYSTSFITSFRTKKEIDQEWKNYFKTLSL